jgi:hypothetical protein
VKPDGSNDVLSKMEFVEPPTSDVESKTLVSPAVELHGDEGVVRETSEDSVGALDEVVASKLAANVSELSRTPSVSPLDEPFSSDVVSAKEG